MLRALGFEQKTKDPFLSPLSHGGLVRVCLIARLECAVTL